jgi:hypothetical protein
VKCHFQCLKYIVITFDDHGNMKLNTTPDVDLGKMVLASWLLMRQAGLVADGIPRTGIVLPKRGLRT